MESTGRDPVLDDRVGRSPDHWLEPFLEPDVAGLYRIVMHLTAARRFRWFPSTTTSSVWNGETLVGQVLTDLHAAPHRRSVAIMDNAREIAGDFLATRRRGQPRHGLPAGAATVEYRSARRGGRPRRRATSGARRPIPSREPGAVSGATWRRPTSAMADGRPGRESFRALYAPSTRTRPGPSTCPASSSAIPELDLLRGLADRRPRHGGRAPDRGGRPFESPLSVLIGELLHQAGRHVASRNVPSTCSGRPTVPHRWSQLISPSRRWSCRRTRAWR